MIQPDPDKPITLVLARHRNLPPERQPKFFARAIRRREAREFSVLIQGMLAARDTDDRTAAADQMEKAIDAMEAKLRSVIVGWEHQTHPQTGQPVAFTPGAADLDLLVTEQELGELVALVRRGGITEDDLKKSGSPSISSSAAAAPTVAAEGQ